MLGQLVEVMEPDRHISLEYGSVIVRSSSGELGRIDLDNLQALIVSHYGVTLSAAVIASLGERGIPLVFPGKNYLPVAMVLPVAGNFEMASRIEAQVNATLPRRKQAWKQVVQSKILMQALVLEKAGADPRSLRNMVGQVRSGDEGNLEAQAARIYWQRLLGREFRRARGEPGVNGLLNYGYTIVRAAMARATVAAGLHPSLSMHHRGALNGMRLVDDLMEPFRPLLDLRVLGLIEVEKLDLDPETKRHLAAVLRIDIPTEAGSSPTSVAMGRLAFSYVRYLQGERNNLELPARSVLEVLDDFLEPPSG